MKNLTKRDLIFFLIGGLLYGFIYFIVVLVSLGKFIIINGIDL